MNSTRELLEVDEKVGSLSSCSPPFASSDSEFLPTPRYVRSNAILRLRPPRARDLDPERRWTDDWVGYRVGYFAWTEPLELRGQAGYTVAIASQDFVGDEPPNMENGCNGLKKAATDGIGHMVSC